MSGHSKWSSIKHKKGAADAKRGAIFTKHARMVTLAAKQGGGDPEMNPTLRMEIDRAKAANMPNANIDRARKKGTGELKDESVITEATYEAYGPGGTALMMHSVTDNKNRALNDIRSIVTKHGGNFGESGSVGWMFERRGYIVIELPQEKSNDEIELAAIDAGAIDIEVSNEMIEVYTEPTELGKVRDTLTTEGLTVKSAELGMFAKENIEISNEATAKKIINLMEKLEDNEDVANIWSNFDISEEVLEKIM
jgi:YebC/PmpR family DNA-binding regulatory protein